MAQQSQLVSSLVSEAQTFLNNEKLSDEDKQKTGLLLLKAKRGLPKFQKLQDAYETIKKERGIK